MMKPFRHTAHAIRLTAISRHSTALTAQSDKHPESLLHSSMYLSTLPEQRHSSIIRNRVTSQTVTSMRAEHLVVSSCTPCRHPLVSVMMKQITTKCVDRGVVCNISNEADWQDRVMGDGKQIAPSTKNLVVALVKSGRQEMERSCRG